MAQTGCGDPPVEANPSTCTEVKEKEHEVHSNGRNKNPPDLISKVAKLESQIEDVTSTLKDEQENRRLIQHELEASRSLCQHLKESLKSQNVFSSKQEKGIQTTANLDLEPENDERKDCFNQRQVVQYNQSNRWKQDLGKYSAASHLIQEYKTNQEIVESQVRKLSQECAARDEEISQVGEKYALVMKQNVKLETEIESLKTLLSKQQEKAEFQESVLEKAEKVLKQKVSEISELQAQKDALARKYGKVTRKVARLKGVVVSFNNTVSEFRKEREQLLNRVSGPQGTRKSEQDSCEVHSANHTRDEKLPCSPKPESSPQSGYSDSSSELIQFERDSSTEPGGWYSGISPEALHFIRSSWTADGVNSHCEEGEVRGLRKWAPDSPYRDRSAVSENQRYARGTERLILQGCESKDSSDEDEDEDDDEERQSGSSCSSDSQEDTSGHQFGRGERFENGHHLCQADIFQKGMKLDRKGRSSCGNVNVPSQKFKETTQTSGKTDSAEGLLLVKHDMENYALRATDRSWHYIYLVHKGRRLWFYENRDFVSLGLTLDGMEPLDLSGAIVCPLRDNVKRRHVFCIQLTCGARYLFQAKDDRDMLFWICRLSAGTGDVRSEHDLLFTQMKAPQRGSPSRTDRLKNFIRGSLSAVMK